MRILKAAGAAALVFALATPAMAATHIGYGMHRHVYRHGMRAQDFDHFDYGIRAPRYHSGWGGPYDDGDYPGSVARNMGPPYW